MAGAIAYATRIQHVMVGLAPRDPLGVDLQRPWCEQKNLTLAETAARAAVTHHNRLTIAPNDRSRATIGAMLEGGKLQRIGEAYAGWGPMAGDLP
jgi:hypothetical protein